MKIKLFIFAWAVLLSASAQNPARVDISGVQSPIGAIHFSPQDSCKISYYKPTPQFGDKMICATFPGSNDWKEGRLEFTTLNDGWVQILLKGAWALGGKNTSCQPLGVYYDDVRLNGELIPNGGFEEGLKNFKVVVSNKKEKEYNARLIADPRIARSGNNCILAWHNSPLQYIARNIKSGETQVLTFFYKTAGDVKPLSEENSFYPLDLRKAANMGFADQYAGDGKGGWSDQGPSNDLHMFKGGLYSFDGAPYSVIDPSKNNEKSCIVFQSSHAKHGKTSVTIPVNKKCNAIRLLNACTWGKNGATPATAEVVFASGKTMTFPLTIGKNTADWWNPQNLPDAKVVWKSGVSSAEVGLYSTNLDLKEDGLVQELRIRSNNTSTVFILVAATGVLINSDPDPLAKFKFTVPLKQDKPFAALPFHTIKLEMMKKGLSQDLLSNDIKQLSRLQILDEKGKAMEFRIASFARSFSHVLLVKNPEKSKKLNLSYSGKENKNIIVSPRAAYRFVTNKEGAEYPDRPSRPGVLIYPHTLKGTDLPIVADEDSFYEMGLNLYLPGKESEFSFTFDLPKKAELSLFMYSRCPENAGNISRLFLDGGKPIMIGGNWSMPPTRYWSGGERVKVAAGTHTVKMKGSHMARGKERTLSRVFLSESQHTPEEPDLTDELDSLTKDNFEVVGYNKTGIAKHVSKDPFRRITAPEKSYPDLSCLVPNLIDKRGFVHREGAAFRFEDGTLLNEIWGCNIGSDWSPQQMLGPRFGGDFIDRYLQYIRTLGYNSVRIQIGTLLQAPGYMADNMMGPLASLNPVTYKTNLPDTLHKLIAACHRNGVYLKISPWNDNCIFMDLGAGRNEFPFIGFFHPEAIRRQQDFIKLILAQPNPYRNNIPPIKDPTLLIYEIENERTFLWGTPGLYSDDWRNIKPETKEILYRCWTDFLKKKYGTTENLFRTWNIPNTKSLLRPGKTELLFENLELPFVWDNSKWGTDKTKIKVKMDDVRITESSFGNDKRSNPVISDGMEFMYEIYRNYLKTMRDFVREIGFKGIVTSCGEDSERYYFQRMGANEVLDAVSGGVGYWNRGGYSFLRSIGWLNPLVYASAPDMPVISREYGSNLINETSWWGHVMAAGIQKAMRKAYLFNFCLGFPDRRAIDWLYPRDSFENRPDAIADHSQGLHLYSTFATMAAGITVRSQELEKSPFKVEIANPLENVCYSAQFRGYNKLTLPSYIPFLYTDSSVNTYKGAYRGKADLVVNEPSIPGGDYSKAKNLFFLKPHSIFDRYGQENSKWFAGKKFDSTASMNTPADLDAFYSALLKAGAPLSVSRKEFGSVWRDQNRKIELNTNNVFFRCETDSAISFIGDSKAPNGNLKAYNVSDCGDAWSFYGRLPDDQRLFFLILNGKVTLKAESPTYLFLAGKDIRIEKDGKLLAAIRAGETVNAGIKAEQGSIADANQVFVTFFRPKSCVMPAEVIFGRPIKAVTACAADGTVLKKVPFHQNQFSNLWELGSDISYYAVKF